MIRDFKNNILNNINIIDYIIQLNYMQIFNLISKNIINFENNIFSSNYKNDDIGNMIKISFKILHDDHYNKYSSKFNFLDDMMNNFFYKNTDNGKELFDVFCKIQRTYYILHKVFYMYKYNKSKTVVDTDLQLNKIKLNETNIVCIYHVNNRYLFKVQDLLKLIYTSLTNSYMHFAEPISIKNPYNNIPFGKDILYYINYKLLNEVNIKTIIPKHLDIFFKFRECNFDMTKFVDNYEYILREYSIQNYLNNTTEDILRTDILNIIKQFNNKIKKNKNRINISEEFPSNELITIFKPYLHLNLVSKYSLVSKNKNEFKKKLFKKLTEFQKFNPQFGRKIIRLKGSIKNGKFKKVMSHIDFNTTHKKFESNNIMDFMSNHLSYKYEDNELENNILDNFQEDENNNTIFNLSIITQIIYNQYNDNNSVMYEEYQEEEQQEEQEEETIIEDDNQYNEQYDELTDEDYDDNESVS